LRAQQLQEQLAFQQRQQQDEFINIYQSSNIDSDIQLIEPPISISSSSEQMYDPSSVINIDQSDDHDIHGDLIQVSDIPEVMIQPHPDIIQDLGEVRFQVEAGTYDALYRIRDMKIHKVTPINSEQGISEPVFLIPERRLMMKVVSLPTGQVFTIGGACDINCSQTYNTVNELVYNAQL
jgi:hypothetical protein